MRQSGFYLPLENVHNGKDHPNPIYAAVIQAERSSLVDKVLLGENRKRKYEKAKGGERKTSFHTTANEIDSIQKKGKEEIFIPVKVVHTYERTAVISKNIELPSHVRQLLSRGSFFSQD